jgi:hypothetical protein
MSRRYGRLVDGIWIQKRMNEKDARRERELRAKQPHLFAPAVVVPVVDVAIVPANPEAPVTPVVDVELQRVATRCPDGGQ